MYSQRKTSIIRQRVGFATKANYQERSRKAYFRLNGGKTRNHQNVEIMETLIILIILLSSGLAIRHYQVRSKHALNHYNFEQGKHEEYKRAYYAKGDALEQLHTLHEMAKFDKKQALRKAAESNKHVLELQNKNAGLKVEADNLRDLLKLAKTEKEKNWQHAIENKRAAMDLLIELELANNTIKEVHKLLNSGAKGKETMSALLITGEYLKVQKNN